jgi:hypothetical protein
MSVGLHCSTNGHLSISWGPNTDSMFPAVRRSVLPIRQHTNDKQCQDKITIEFKVLDYFMCF